MGKGRLEAFSDGVLAVAITLLVLDLRIDSAQPLGEQLHHEWPSFAAYAISFLLIGIVWINHHALFALAAQVDRLVLLLNLILLMWVTTIPFTTSTLAAYLRQHGSDARVAVLLYGASMEGMAISFTLILWALLRRNLTIRSVPRDEASRAVRRFGLGTLVYPLVALGGLFSPVLMLLLYAALALYYLTERTPILADATETVN